MLPRQAPAPPGRRGQQQPQQPEPRQQPQPQQPPGQRRVREPWTEGQGQELQKAVDKIFGSAASLKGLQFSFTIADPSLKDCPLIGCSTGFGTLCGYEMHEIVGRNCRFLVDPVPKEQINDVVRQIARDYCAAVRDGREYRVPEHMWQAWMPQSRPSDDGVFCFQTNARKDGTLFRNMFYMKMMELDDHRYIAGLQTELPAGQDYAVYHEACRLLDENMGHLERLLASKFWCFSAMRRQDDKDLNDGYSPGPPQQAEKRPCSPGSQSPGQVHALKKPWTSEQGNELQRAVDLVFGVAGDNLKGLRFSLSLADPCLPGCPLIGCSTGFGTLCGYSMDEIVGRNCRFLVDPVPKELINSNVRHLCRDFCEAVKEGREYVVPESELEPWMLQARAADDGIFCAQMNARKDGTLFENMFYLRRVELDERPYIVGLQTELPPGSLASAAAGGMMGACHEACRLLDAHMAEVETVLSGMFWYTSPMRRQEDDDPDDGFQDPASPSLSPSLNQGPTSPRSPSPDQVDFDLPTSMQRMRSSTEAAPAHWLSWLCCRSAAAVVPVDELEDMNVPMERRQPGHEEIRVVGS